MICRRYAEICRDNLNDPASLPALKGFPICSFQLGSKPVSEPVGCFDQTSPTKSCSAMFPTGLIRWCEKYEFQLLLILLLRLEARLNNNNPSWEGRLGGPIFRPTGDAKFSTHPPQQKKNVSLARKLAQKERNFPSAIFIMFHFCTCLVFRSASLRWRWHNGICAVPAHQPIRGNLSGSRSSHPANLFHFHLRPRLL